MSIRSLGDILNKAILNIAGEKYRNYTRILLQWKNIVGEKVAENSSPAHFNNGILKVAVKNSIWMQEMILYKYRIISSYKKKGIQIKDIIFYLDVSHKKWGT